jgi:Transposase, Mutator family
VTDSVLEAVVEWQNRPLERSYPVVYFDALRVKIRDEGSVRNKAVYSSFPSNFESGSESAILDATWQPPTITMAK